jgi:hypothetical protein
MLASELDTSFKDIKIIKNQIKAIALDKIESIILPNGSII